MKSRASDNALNVGTRLREHGLCKLAEELGECGQVVGKLLQFPELQLDEDGIHPDGTQLRRRLQDEMGDVMAACIYVTQRLKLDELCIDDRAQRKLRLFNSWDKE